MSEPISTRFSPEDLLKGAAAYMREYYGPIPKDEPARSEWYRNYGMLIDFCGELWRFKASPIGTPFSHGLSVNGT